MRTGLLSWAALAVLVVGAGYRLAIDLEDPWAYLLGAGAVGLLLLKPQRRRTESADGYVGNADALSDIALQDNRVLRERIDRFAIPRATEEGDGPPVPIGAASADSEPAIVAKVPQPDEKPGGFEELQRKHAQPALALLRPYPPDRSISVRSHVGGLPSLPAMVPWPRAIDDRGCIPAGAPLHFLGQVDLAEQLWVPNDFPLKGTVLFFGALPDGYFWDTPNDARVIYDPTSSGVETQPPVDLGTINGGYGDYQAQFGDDDWLRCRIFPKWPLVGSRIRTMPELGAFAVNAFHDPSFAGYYEAQNDHRASEIAGVLGTSLDEIASRPIPTIAEVLGSPGFPWTPRYIALWARWMLLHGFKSTYEVGLHRAVLQWREWADSASSAPLGKAKADEFAAFLTEQRLDLAEIDPSGRILQQLVSEAGSDPMLAASLPGALYDLAAEGHRPVNPRRSGTGTRKDGKIDWVVRHHQMGGYVPSTQKPKAIDFDRICLMQFQSDPGVKMILCDMGEADFWIRPADLERGDFHDVRAFTQGG